MRVTLWMVGWHLHRGSRRLEEEDEQGTCMQLCWAR